MSKLRIDLGCGSAKREGFVGLDYVDLPEVDHVLDLTTERFPFDDDSVDEVFSAHFLEHIDEPNHVFEEIGRICRDGARIEIWTPYAWTNEAFLYGHIHYISEEMWQHLGVSHRDVYASMLKGRWQLRRFVFVVDEATLADLAAYSTSIDFAIKYFKGVVREFGVEIEYRSDLDVDVVEPERVYATERFGPRRPLSPPRTSSARRTAQRAMSAARRRWERYGSAVRSPG
jgi:predicted SAM-dependent methyltransferase